MYSEFRSMITWLAWGLGAIAVLGLFARQGSRVRDLPQKTTDYWFKIATFGSGLLFGAKPVNGPHRFVLLHDGKLPLRV